MRPQGTKNHEQVRQNPSRNQNKRCNTRARKSDAENMRNINNESNKGPKINSNLSQNGYDGKIGKSLNTAKKKKGGKGGLSADNLHKKEDLLWATRCNITTLGFHLERRWTQ